MFKKVFLVLFLMFVLMGVGCSLFEKAEKDIIVLPDYNAGGELDEEDKKVVPHVDIIVSDEFKVKSVKDYEKSIYLYVKNNTEEFLDFKNNLEKQFADLGFEIVEKPSLAEYIMLIDILALGQAGYEYISESTLDPQTEKLDLEGLGTYFLMFDLVLVLRSHPKDNKVKNDVIRLSAVRSAKDHYKMRAALTYKDEIRPKNRVFGHVLADNVVYLLKNSIEE